MARNRIVRDIRSWFEGQGFTEVDCGALQVSPGNEAHLHGFATALINPDGSREQRYLHTSPEFACKKLLAAGETKIFDLARVYRNRERTPLHAPEFTMLEWYRANESYGRVIADAVALVRQASGGNILAWRGGVCDPGLEPEWLTVAEAFLRYAGVDVLKFPQRDDLARHAPVRVADDDSWSDIFSRILVEKVEPMLGRERLTILHDYPVAEEALARVCPHDPRVAERFELYAASVELANGFGELTDAAEQRRRFEAEMEVKEKLYGERYPIDEELLTALAMMPEAAGVALGLDRLVMLAAGATHIDQVQWTPLD